MFEDIIQQFKNLSDGEVLSLICYFGVPLIIVFFIILHQKSKPKPIFSRAKVVFMRQRADYGFNYYYYVTFETESGRRSELRVPQYRWGLFQIGDTGMLCTRRGKFLGFTRDT